MTATRKRTKATTAADRADVYAEKVASAMREGAAAQLQAQQVAIAEARSNIRLNMAASFLQCRLRESPNMTSTERARAAVEDADALLDALEEQKVGA